MELEEHERTRTEIWTRVMGYHRPVSAWNVGKQAEHKERRFFDEKKGLKALSKPQPEQQTERESNPDPFLGVGYNAHLILTPSASQL